MRFSPTKLLPLLLPFLQAVSAGAIPDLATSLPSLKIVGSFSVGIEGLSAPLTIRRDVEFPLAPLGQKLLEWTGTESTPTTVDARRSQISTTASYEDDNAHALQIMSSEEDESERGLIDVAEQVDDRSEEETSDPSQIVEGDGMQVVLRQPDAQDTERRVDADQQGKKRKAVEADGVEVEDAMVRKKSKFSEEALDLEKGKADRKKSSGKSGRGDGRRRCRHCRHRKGGSVQKISRRLE